MKSLKVKTANISVIIPTLNEEQFLERTLLHIIISRPKIKEIIIVDGGSNDRTLDIAREYECKIVIAQQGRSIQMNAGAKEAKSDILCFVHADTFVPSDFSEVIIATLSDQKIVCGGFKTIMSSAKKTYWLISFHNTIKTYYGIILRPHLHWRGMRVLFGDQAMFCRRSDFFSIGMFDEQAPIMEEVDLCKRISKLGKVLQVDRVVETSARRIEKWGILKATLIHLYIGVFSQLGVSLAFLKKAYPNQDELEKQDLGN